MSVRTAALLIDDDARLAALVTEYLGEHGIDVTVAGDARRGLAALKSGRFDVVLLDVVLPGTSSRTPRSMERRPSRSTSGALTTTSP